MTTVIFPELHENFTRALQEILDAYFDGASHTVGGNAITFPDCDISFSRVRFDQEDTKPLIAIIGDKIKGTERQKCNDPDGIRPCAYEDWTEIEKIVFVRVKVSSGNSELSFRQATRIYDMLYAIITTQLPTLCGKNIEQPRLSPVPVDLSDEENHVVSGFFRAKIRATFVMDDA